MILASFFLTKHRNVTDGQTDGRTDTAMANTAVALQAMGPAVKMVEKVKQGLKWVHGESHALPSKKKNEGH